MQLIALITITDVLVTDGVRQLHTVVNKYFERFCSYITSGQQLQRFVSDKVGSRDANTVLYLEIAQWGDKS